MQPIRSKSHLTLVVLTEKRIDINERLNSNKFFMQNNFQLRKRKERVLCIGILTRRPTDEIQVLFRHLQTQI